MYLSNILARLGIKGVVLTGGTASQTGYLAKLGSNGKFDPSVVPPTVPTPVNIFETGVGEDRFDYITANPGVVAIGDFVKEKDSDATYFLKQNDGSAPTDWLRIAASNTTVYLTGAGQTRQAFATANPGLVKQGQLVVEFDSGECFYLNNEPGTADPDLNGDWIKISSASTSATNVSFSSTGNVSSLNVQAAIAELDSEKISSLYTTSGALPSASAANNGHIAYLTDLGSLVRSNGTTWLSIIPGASDYLPNGLVPLAWGTIHGYGTLAARPVASTANNGLLYYSTTDQVLYRSNGTSWDTLTINSTFSNDVVKSKIYVMENVSLSTAASTSVAIESGTTFYLDEICIIHTATVTSSLPVISVGITGNNTKYLDNVTLDLGAVGSRQKIIVDSINGETTNLTFTVNITSVTPGVEALVYFTGTFFN